ncbi:MAG: hypothetical protein JWR72_1887 [Flavisolibacter sp.]|jgi:hypothetical protein|nr:hypothetical protein [Flavisolibacter sp.]
MNTQPPSDSNIPSATGGANETIFGDLADTTKYEKGLKNARIYLYIIAALQVGVGIYEYVTTDDKNLALIAGGLDAGIGILFLLFAVWSYKKPAPAFITALITFLVIHIALSVLDPTHLYRGIILKILVVIALIKGFKDARQVEKIKASIGS